MSGRRPELAGPPEIYYNGGDSARKYSQNTRVMQIQQEMAERAYELLEVEDDEPKLLLDLGCGSGLSGAVLDSYDHHWVGIDVSKAMLDVAQEREAEGELILGDLGDGIPFRPGSFDGAISVSALQWLCNADKTDHNPVKRLYTLFSSLYSALTSGSRAVFQFYPSDQKQIDFIMKQATRAGFSGGLQIDFPESSKKKKYYLVLQVGGVLKINVPAETIRNDSQVSYSQTNGSHQRHQKRGKGRHVKSVKEWIQDKKDRRRRQGRDTAPDSKYTGRKRSSRF